MDQNNSLKLGDVISMVSDFFKYYLSFKRFNTILISVCIIASLLFYAVEKPKYEGVASFVLMDGGGSKVGGLASLGSQFGLDLGSLGGQSNSIFSGENIFDIFKTRSIIESVLLTPYQKNKGEISITLADAYMQMHSSTIQKLLGNEPATPGMFVNYNPINGGDRKKDSVLNELYKDIIKKNLFIDKLNKKGSIIQLRVITRNEIFSKLFAERLIEQVKFFYINIKNANTQQAINNLQFKADSLQQILGRLYNKSFEIIRPNPSNLLNENAANALSKQKDYTNFNYSNITNTEMTQRDKTVAYTLYAEVIKNLEITKLSQAQQAPIFQVLDLPKYPLEDKKTKIILLIPFAILLGLVLSVAIAFLKYLFK
jgi:hypothetical protein